MNQEENLRKWLGSPNFIAIDGAGHMPQVEKPEEFLEAMKKGGGCSGFLDLVWLKRER